MKNFFYKLTRKKLIFPLWLLAALLFGFSWSMFFDVNLAFLAWFAFMPLFIELEKKETFWSFYGTACLFSVTAYLIIGHGSLVIAAKQWLIFLAALDELFMPTVSFALLYPFKKRFGFNKALLLFPFIISLWEWIYQKFEHTFSYPMLSHSQSNNVMFVQYIDIFGVWSIACWVMLFNVLLFLLYKKVSPNFSPLKIMKGLAGISAFMILPVLSYYVIRYNYVNENRTGEINITLIKTDFDLLGKPGETKYEKAVREVERLTFLTDSIDYEFNLRSFKSDLYVWYEGAVDFGNQKIFTDFIDTAVNDWQTPLLTGMQILPENTYPEDKRLVNRAALFHINENTKTELQYYDKVRLSPGHERIPYHELLAKLPGFPVPLNSPAFFKNADSVSLIELKTQGGRKVKLGTPICLEQHYSYIWSDMAEAGAECFVQLGFESWWSVPYFLKQIDNIVRLRCIETRRSLARCVNGGMTGFIDPLGNIYAETDKREGTVTASIFLYSDVTFFSRHQYIFPVLCTLLILSGTILFEINNREINKR